MIITIITLKILSKIVIFQPAIVYFYNFLQSFTTTHSNKEKLYFLLKNQIYYKRVVITAEFVATFHSFEKSNYFLVILIDLSLFYFKHV